MKIFHVQLRCDTNNGCMDFDDGELVLSEIFTHPTKSDEDFKVDCAKARKHWDNLNDPDVNLEDLPESDSMYFNWFLDNGYVVVEYTYHFENLN